MCVRLAVGWIRRAARGEKRRFWGRRRWCFCPGWAGWQSWWRKECDWDGMSNRNDEIHSNTVGCDPSLEYSMEMKKIKIFICMFLWWKSATWLKYFMKVNRWIEFYTIPPCSSALPHFGRIFRVVLVFVSRLCLSFVYNNSSSSFPFALYQLLLLVIGSPDPKRFAALLCEMLCCVVEANAEMLASNPCYGPEGGEGSTFG